MAMLKITTMDILDMPQLGVPPIASEVAWRLLFSKMGGIQVRLNMNHLTSDDNCHTYVYVYIYIYI